MRKIEDFFATTNKAKSGSLSYCLWVSDEGALYVQIDSNNTDTNNPVSHSNLIFKVSDYACLSNTDKAFKEMRGINPINFSEEASKNKNDPGFVKAIIKNMLP